MANRYFNVKINSGTAPGPYNIYYDQINVSNYTTRTFTNLSATNVTYSDLTTGDGVNVFFPDTATKLYVYNIQCNSAIVFTLPLYSCDVDYTILEITEPEYVTITYEIYKLNSNATGYVTDGITQSEKIVKKVLWNSDMSITGVSTNSSIFVGWSFYQGTQALIQTAANFRHSADLSSTYYALINKIFPIEKKFCKYGIDVAESIICNSCETQITIYYDKTQFDNNGINNIIWYKDQSLTTVVDNGYYKEYFSTSTSLNDKPLVYKLIGGTIPLSSITEKPEFTICCDCGIIDCQNVLDIYGGVTAAYSLRKLSSTYTDFSIRVRRSSDNTELNIGFIGDQLNTSALLTFCGSSNGFVSTWYDQSGNLRHLTQPTAANQPRIVSSGVLELVNNRPAIYFDGIDDSISVGFSSSVSADAFTIFDVFKINDSNNFVTHTLSGGYVLAGNTTNPSPPDGVPYISRYKNSVLTSTTTQTEVKAAYSTNTQILFTEIVNTTSVNSFGISNYTSWPMTGHFQECILYQVNQVTNKNEIEKNIDSYYSIIDSYSDIVRTNLTHLYDAGNVSSYPGSGTVWTNLVGSGGQSLLRSGSVQSTNGPTFVSAGVSSSFAFDGINDNVLINSNTSWTNKSFTVNIIAKWPSMPYNNNTDSTDRMVVFNGTPVQLLVGRAKAFGDITSTRFFPSNGVGNFEDIIPETYDGNVFVSASVITMLTYVSDTTSVKLYKNGTYITQSDLPLANGVASYSTSTTTLFSSGGGGFMSGSLYHYMFYSSSLSGTEITQNYKVLKTKYGI